MSSATSFDGFVLAVLVREHRNQAPTATLESLERWQLSRTIAVDIVVNHRNHLDYFTFLEKIKARHPGKHLIVVHDDVYFTEDFLHRILEQINIIEDSNILWGLLGPAGVTYPYFKIVRNMVDYHGILYPFPHPLPAIHLDAHLLVIHKELVFNFDPTYRGFHHYDTLLCMRSWAQGLPVLTINLPLRHLGKGNVPEWQEMSAALGRMLGKTYDNRTLMTTMGPVALDVQAGAARDFYKHDVEPTLLRCFGHRAAPSVVLIVRVDGDDENVVRETLLSVCAQFDKPAQVFVLCPARQRASLDATFRYFGDFVDLTLFSPDHSIGIAAGDVLMGCGAAIRPALPEGTVVAFLNCGTILFPNYVRDVRRFYTWGVGVGGVAAALDFNYVVHDQAHGRGIAEGDERLVISWKTETVDDLVSGGVIPLASFAMPADVAKSVISDHLHGVLTERIFTFKLAARARVFFLRRLGGLVRQPPSEFAPPDAFAEIAERAEFLRTAYPFASLWMKLCFPVDAAPSAQNPVSAPAFSREQLLVMKLSQHPRLIDGIFKLHGVVKRLRNLFGFVRNSITKIRPKSDR